MHRSLGFITIAALWPAAASAGFEPVSAADGPAAISAASGILTDIDGDGFVDFIHRGEDVWLGHGDGTFSLGPSCGPSGPPVVADFDNDGRVDVFRVGDDPVICFGQADGSLLVGADSVEQNPSAGLDTEGPAASGAAVLDVNGDGWVEVYMTNYEGPGMVWFRDVLYLNDQAGNLDVAFELPKPAYAGRGVTAGDFDEDADPDLYVSNYRLVWNYLWRNNGNGFVDEAEALGALGHNGHTISSAFGDLNGDAHLDILVGNFAHPGQPTITVLLNDLFGSGGFVDMGNGGIEWQESYAGVALGDYDNDGDLDAFITTVYQGDEGRLYQNQGNATFVDVTEAEGLAGQSKGYTVSWGDVNDDGFLDLYLGGQQDRHLFLNQPNEHHWVKIRLVGDGEQVGVSAIGAGVSVHAGDRTIVREVQAEGGERGANAATVHAGLGAHAGPIDIEVRWPWAETCHYEAQSDSSVDIVYEPGCDEDADPDPDDTDGTDDTDDTDGTSGDGASDTDEATPAGDGGEAGGCGCRSSTPVGAAGLILLPLALLRRRVRR